MDSKKVLEKLLRIAENQQKIIMKLAQQQVQEFAPQHLDPAKTQKDSAGALLAALPPPVKMNVSSLKEQGNDMLLSFHPGKATQANYDAIMRTMQDLTNKNVLQHAFNLKVV